MKLSANVFNKIISMVFYLLVIFSSQTGYAVIKEKCLVGNPGAENYAINISPKFGVERITLEIAQEIADIFKEDSMIHDLVLVDVTFDPGAWQIIVEATARRGLLRTLEIRRIKLSGDEREVASIIENNPSLTVLILEDTSLKYDGLDIIYDTLSKHAALSYLNLAGNCADFDTLHTNYTEVIARILAKQPKLTHLFLGRNHLTSQDTLKIVEALHGKVEFICLDFGDNEIGPEGVKRISNILKNNPNLATVNFRGNKLGTGGLLSILNNTSMLLKLAHLNLSNGD